MKRKVKYIVERFVPTILSLAQLLIRKNKKTNLPKLEERNRKLIILGNGPSLQDFLQHVTMEEMRDRCDIVCCNQMATTESYQQIQPRYYVLADPAYWGDYDEKAANIEETKRSVEMCLDAISSKTTWDMVLILPSHVDVRPGTRLYRMLEEQSNIYLGTCNTYCFQGYQWIQTLLARIDRSAPAPLTTVAQNVIGTGIYAGIVMGYRTICLTGVDSTLYKEVVVNDKNQVVYRNVHFYQDEDEFLVMQYKLHELLELFVITFRMYQELAVYARNEGVKIYNLSEGSYIDAFERKTIKEAWGDDQKN